MWRASVRQQAEGSCAQCNAVALRTVRELWAFATSAQSFCRIVDQVGGETKVRTHASTGGLGPCCTPDQQFRPMLYQFWACEGISFGVPHLREKMLRAGLCQKFHGRDDPGKAATPPIMPFLDAEADDRQIIRCRKALLV